MYSVFQLLLLIVTTLLFHKGTTNPNLGSAGDHLPSEGVAGRLVVFVAPVIDKTLVWASTLYQVLYLYLQAASPAWTVTLFPYVPTSPNPLRLTTLSLLGFLLMIIDGLGRIWCYRTLGKFFTFQLSIRNSHKLIKTGPYAYVRHPTYTFATIMTMGMFLVHQRLANFFLYRKWIHIIFGPLGFLSCCLIVYVFIKMRVAREEAELAKAFGREWKEYQSKTKRFLPGLI